MLVAAHVVSGRTLLVDVGRGTRRPRWTVTLRRLRTIAGPWLRDDERDANTMEWLSEQLAAERAERVSMG